MSNRFFYIPHRISGFPCQIYLALTHIILFTGVILTLMFTSCSDFYLSMTKNGDAIYVPPPDTVLDTMWVQDSLIIPLSYSYLDTVLREQFTLCQNSSVSLRFSLSATGSLAEWNNNEISVAGALNGPDFPDITLYKEDQNETVTPFTEQYNNSINENYYFQQDITQPGQYTLQLTEYDLDNTLEEFSLSAYILQSGASESMQAQVDSSHLTMICSTAIAFEDSLPPSSAIWSEPLVVRSGDSLWGEYNSFDSLETYLIREQQLTSVLQSLVRQETLDPPALFNSTLDSDTLALSIAENDRILLLIFNPSASNQFYGASVRQIIDKQGIQHYGI